jgi:hypothetical protein
MGSMREPTVFSNEWKCGEALKPTTKEGKVVDEVLSCRAPKNKRSVIPGREHDFNFFEKREGYDCNSIMSIKKRQMEGMGHGYPSSIPTHNVIQPIPGKQAYARVSGGMYNEMFYQQAADSGLMTLGAQHGVSFHSRVCVSPVDLNNRVSVLQAAGCKVVVIIPLPISSAFRLTMLLRSK